MPSPIRTTITMSPDSAEALRWYAKEHKIPLRDAPAHAVQYIEDELRDAAATWPDWATQCLKMIRAESGYDGYDDLYDGVDMPQELAELIGHYNEVAGKLTVTERARLDALSQLKADHGMSAWGHIRAAWRESPLLTGFVIGGQIGLVLVCVVFLSVRMG